MSPADLLAVVDLGSNSFRLEVARLEENRLLSLLYRKETVRLAGGFAPDGTLTPEMQERALSALTRFRECLAGVAPENILAVGTHAMRRASQNAAFLCAAERALGVPIEIISGEREASFAFSGAVRSLPYSAEERLVVDIGGGTTDIGVRTMNGIAQSASLKVAGAAFDEAIIRHLRRRYGLIGFFPDGRITPDRQKAALEHAMTVLGDAAKTFPEASSSEAYMTAGTFRAVVETCRNLGWTKEEVRLEHIEELIARLLRSKGRFAQAFPGMRTDRYEVIAGGLTVLQAVYRTLGLREARLSQGGVRVGLLYELLGNPPYRDEREASVRDLARRLSLDTAQGERVASWAGRLLSLLVPEATDGLRRNLHTAALLHESGQAITGHNASRIAAQFLRNWPLPGVARADRLEAANLLQWQEGPLPEDPRPDERDPFWRAVLALRLALLFLQARTEPSFPDMRYDERSGTLTLPAVWLQDRPFTDQCLREEEERWKNAGLALRIDRE